MNGGMKKGGCFARNAEDIDCLTWMDAFFFLFFCDKARGGVIR